MRRECKIVCMRPMSLNLKKKKWIHKKHIWLGRIAVHVLDFGRTTYQSNEHEKYESRTDVTDLISSSVVSSNDFSPVWGLISPKPTIYMTYGIYLLLVLSQITHRGRKVPSLVSLINIFGFNWIQSLFRSSHWTCSF